MMEEGPVIDTTAAQQVIVKYTVRDQATGREFTDAIYYTPEQYLKVTPEDIEAEQQRRYANWVAVITAPPVEPTAEQKAEHVEMLKQQQLAAQDQILRAVSPEDALVIMDRQLEIIRQQRDELAKRVE